MDDIRGCLDDFLMSHAKVIGGYTPEDDDTLEIIPKEKSTTSLIKKLFESRSNRSVSVEEYKNARTYTTQHLPPVFNNESLIRECCFGVTNEKCQICLSMRSHCKRDPSWKPSP